MVHRTTPHVPNLSATATIRPDHLNAVLRVRIGLDNEADEDRIELARSLSHLAPARKPETT